MTPRPSIQWTVATLFSVLALLILLEVPGFGVTQKLLMDTDSVQSASNKTFVSPAITGNVTGGASYADIALSGIIGGGATFPNIFLTGTVLGGATYSNIDLSGTLGPLRNLGDTLYAAAGGVVTRLAGNTTTALQSLFQVGTGTSSAAPVWLGIPGDLHNVGLASSVNANAWTIALKGENGNDPSAANPVSVKLRSNTLTTGTPVWMTRTSALSATVPNTGVLGTTANTPYRIWIAASTTNGTAWNVLCLFNTQIVTTGAARYIALPSEAALLSATLLDASSDSAGVLYCSTATTNMPVKWIGYAEITEGTAGEWATEETTIHVLEPGGPRSGDTLQIRQATTTTAVNNDTSGFVDTTLTDTIVMGNASNMVRVWVSQTLLESTNMQGTSARILRGSTALITFAAGILGATDSATQVVTGFVLDAPVTAGNVAYKTDFAHDSNNARAIAQPGSRASFIYLEEVFP